MGSLARGGFSESASDIDIGLLLANPLLAGDGELVEQVKVNAASQHPAVDNKISIFWGSVQSINGDSGSPQYSPFDRIDLIEHGELIAGKDIRHTLVRPPTDELEIEGASKALQLFADRNRLKELCNPRLLADRDDVYIARLVLFPARYIFISLTGNAGGHDLSAAFYTKRFRGIDADLVAMAYRLRLQPLAGQPVRNSLRVSQLLEGGLGLLYIRFLDIYCDRLGMLGQSELVSALTDFKQTLTAKNT
jgi:hypothetical protein